MAISRRRLLVRSLSDSVARRGNSACLFIHMYICTYIHIEVGTMLVHNDFRYQITLVRGFYCSMYFTCCLLLSSLPSSVFCPPSRSCLLLPA